MYKIILSRQAIKDVELLKRAKLAEKTKKILGNLKDNPFYCPPPYESLVGDLKGAYSRRINLQHRLVYQVFEQEKIIRILRMWTHYDDVRL